MLVEAAIERRTQDWRTGVALAWHVEAFARTKRLPALKALLQERPAAAPQGASFEALRAHLQRYQAHRDMKKAAAAPVQP